MDAYEAYYPRGWQATVLKMEELVDEMPNIEYTPTPVLQELLAPTESEARMSQQWITLLRKIP